MPSRKVTSDIPSNYAQIKGSERHPSSKARLLGPADPQERFTVTIILRRRTDGEPIPPPDHFRKTPLRDRQGSLRKLLRPCTAHTPRT